jgi:amidase
VSHPGGELRDLRRQAVTRAGLERALFGDVPAGLATPGPLSHHVVDAAAMLDVMQGYAIGDPHWAAPPQRPYRLDAVQDPEPLRIGLLTTSPFGVFAPDTIAVTEAAARLLEKLGHTVDPLDTISVDASFKDQFETVWAAGIAALPIPVESLEPFNAALIERGNALTGAQVMEAIAGLQTASRMIVGATAAFDVVLSPTMMREPLRIGELAHLAGDAGALFDALSDYIGLTPVANVTGQPSMSLPAGLSDNGLPLGVMITGRPADEATLFSLAGQVQRADDWTVRRPPVVA